MQPINQAGGARRGTVYITYQKICQVLGFTENVQDDPYKVEASFGFEDQNGRKAFLWCYKEPKKSCTSWSADGDFNLLRELFPGKVIQD